MKTCRAIKPRICAGTKFFELCLFPARGFAAGGLYPSCRKIFKMLKETSFCLRAMTEAAKPQRVRMLTLTKKQHENGLSQTYWENVHEIHQDSIVHRNCAGWLVCGG
jgi:hypothetical protein